jgi:protein involved in polysaccharide export with SLBB domain
VEIARVRADFSREILHVDVRSLWASGGKPDPARDIKLKPKDRINVHPEVIGPKIVALSGEVRRPGVCAIAAGERRSSVLQRARIPPNRTAILYQPEENIEYYLARAGGATRQADLEQAYIS